MNVESNHKVREPIRDKIFFAFIVIFLAVFVIITLYPVVNTVALSFNDGIDAVRGGIYLWPRKFSMKNYKTVLDMQNNNSKNGNSYIDFLVCQRYSGIHRK